MKREQKHKWVSGTVGVCGSLSMQSGSEPAVWTQEHYTITFEISKLPLIMMMYVPSIDQPMHCVVSFYYHLFFFRISITALNHHHAECCLQKQLLIFLVIQCYIKSFSL